jgi:putative flavoprotein involved in K+ transport
MKSFAEHHQVVVIGGGPAGLSVAYELAKRGIELIILEKGRQAGNSFTRFPKNIFFGPWLNNLLPGSRVALNWVLRRSTQAAYSHYLAQYSEKNHLPLFANTGVTQLEHRTDGAFVLHTSRGEVATDLVVNATGYFSKPYIPEYPGLRETSIKTMHVAEYREPRSAREKLGRETGKILVVGKRLSAGETFCELYLSGFQVSLSHRGKLVFGPSRWQENLISPLVYVWERLAVLLRLKLNSYPRMAGGLSEKLIKDGTVRTFPNIARFGKNTVVFENQVEEHFDLVVFATGYRPAVDHLPMEVGDFPGPQLCEMESTTVPGLFFLGVDGQRTYRSRFLRGLREDATVLADKIAKRIAALRPTAKPAVLAVPIEERVFEPLEDEVLARLS